MRFGPSSAATARVVSSTRSSPCPRSRPRSPWAPPSEASRPAAVPVGNAAGNLITSWLNPTSIIIGVIAVAASGHLATAVYLAADARRQVEPRLLGAFRARALVASITTGALALIGLAVMRADAPQLFSRLDQGAGLGAVAVSGAAGVMTIGLVWFGRYELARYAGATAVAAIIAGWTAAQAPDILPGLSIEAASAGRATTVTVIVVIGIGALVLVPSLVLLFRLFLKGTFDPSAVRESIPPRRERGRIPVSLVGILVVLLVVGSVLTVFAGRRLGSGPGGRRAAHLRRRRFHRVRDVHRRRDRTRLYGSGGAGRQRPIGRGPHRP